MFLGEVLEGPAVRAERWVTEVLEEPRYGAPGRELLVVDGGDADAAVPGTGERADGLLSRAGRVEVSR